MQPHEFANLFPMMSESEIKTLALDIKERGQQNPIWVLDGKILDGRNRFEACRSARITPRMEIYSGDDPLGFVISSNLHRRHLTESQRAMVAVKLATITNGKHHADPIGSAGLTIQQAADALQVGRTSVVRAKMIHSKGVPELSEAVASGEIKLGTAETIVSLPAQEQKDIVQKGGEAVYRKAMDIRAQNTRDDSRASARMPKYIPSDSKEIWQQAKITLERILPNDKHREEVLEEIIHYCKDRIKNKK